MSQQLAQAYVDRQLRNAHAKGHRQSLIKWQELLRQFVQSPSTQTQINDLDTFQRKLIHRLCQRYNLEKEVRNLQEDRGSMLIRKGQLPTKMTQLTVVEIIEAKKEVDQTEYKVTDAKPKRVLLRNKNEVKQQNSEQNKKIAVCEMEKTKSQDKVDDVVQCQGESIIRSLENGQSNNAVFQNQYEYDPEYDRNEYPQPNRAYGMMPPMYYGMGYCPIPMGINMLGQPVPLLIPSMANMVPPMYQSHNARKAKDVEQKTKKQPPQNIYRQKKPASNKPQVPTVVEPVKKFAYEQSDFPAL